MHCASSLYKQLHQVRPLSWSQDGRELRSLDITYYILSPPWMDHLGYPPPWKWTQNWTPPEVNTEIHSPLNGPAGVHLWMDHLAYHSSPPPKHTVCREKQSIYSFVHYIWDLCGSNLNKHKDTNLIILFTFLDILALHMNFEHLAFSYTEFSQKSQVCIRSRISTI